MKHFSPCGVGFWGLAMLALCSCESMVETSLYQVDKSMDREHPVAYFPYTDIYMDAGNSRLFGAKAHPCKVVRTEQEGSYQGEDHLSIQWDQTTDCKYLGVGFPWADFKGKDLTALESCAAIQLAIRLPEGESHKLPVFFSLQDYAGKQCNAKMNLLDVEGGVFDGQWRLAQIPLRSFHAHQKGVNLANIKELRLEFQRQGHIHIDAMSLVAYEHAFPVPAAQVIDKCTSLPLVLGANREHFWGVAEEDATGIHWGTPEEGTKVKVALTPGDTWNDFGCAIHGWERLDVSDLMSTTALKFKVQGKELPDMRVSCVVASGKPRISALRVDSMHVLPCPTGGWEVLLPLKSFDQNAALDWTAFREIRIKMLGAPEVSIDNMELVEFRGSLRHPRKWLNK